jgi:hypothetical protein
MPTTWLDITSSMLRTMINDSGADLTYPDSRIEEVLITSAYLLPLEIKFDTNYIADVVNYTITPDPLTTTDGKDFMSFMVLKGSCLMDESAFRSAALIQGITARCGPAALQVGNHGAYLKDLVNLGPCQLFRTLKTRYRYEGGKTIRAVMSPFVSNNFSTWNAWRTH